MSNNEDNPLIGLLGEELTTLNQIYAQHQIELGVQEVPITNISMRLTCLIRQIFPEAEGQLKFEVTVVQSKIQVLVEMKEEIETQKEEQEKADRIRRLTT